MINTIGTLAKGCNRELVNQWFAICFPDHQKHIDAGSELSECYRQEWYYRFDNYGLDAICYMDTENTVAFIDLLKKKYRYDELKGKSNSVKITNLERTA